MITKALSLLSSAESYQVRQVREPRVNGDSPITLFRRHPTWVDHIVGRRLMMRSCSVDVPQSHRVETDHMDSSQDLVCSGDYGLISGILQREGQTYRSVQCYLAQHAPP
jgi:hypothetical protein